MPKSLHQFSKFSFLTALLFSTLAYSQARVGNVPKSEQESMRTRVNSKNAVYFGFGPSNYQGLGTTALGYNLALGYNWEVNPFAAVRVLASTVIASDAKTAVSDGILGLNYYFSDLDVAPYVFGGLGFGVAGTTASNATTVGGFAGAIGVGLQLFRISTTQLDLILDDHVIFANNTVGTPGYYSLRLGVQF